MVFLWPAFGHLTILSLPHLPILIRPVFALVGGYLMGTTQDHRKYAEDCMAMARQSEDDSDKALWLTLAQSWVRLAEHAAGARERVSASSDGDDMVAERPLPDRD